MPRHTRCWPRDRQERERANERAARLLEALEQQASEVRALEAAARQAEKQLRERIVRHVDARELDISEIAHATGISRQTIHRLLRARKPARRGPSGTEDPRSASATQPTASTVKGAPSEPPPKWVVGQRVLHPSRGVGTVERANGPALLIRFDIGERSELHAEIAGIAPL